MLDGAQMLAVGIMLGSAAISLAPRRHKLRSWIQLSLLVLQGGWGCRTLTPAMEVVAYLVCMGGGALLADGATYFWELANMQSRRPLSENQWVNKPLR